MLRVLTSAALLVGVTAAPAAAQLVLSTNHLQFADQAIGIASQPQTVTVTNTGEPLYVGAVLLSGPDATSLSATNGCFGLTLATGDACTVSVTFTPLHAGPIQARLLVSTLDYSVSLSGSGVGTTPTYTVPHYRIDAVDALIPYPISTYYVSGFNNHDVFVGVKESNDDDGCPTLFDDAAFIFSNGTATELRTIPGFPVANPDWTPTCSATVYPAGIDDADEVFFWVGDDYKAGSTNFRYANGVFTLITPPTTNDIVVATTSDGVVVFGGAIGGRGDMSYWLNGQIVQSPSPAQQACAVVFDALQHQWVTLGSSAAYGSFCYGDFNLLTSAGGYSVGFTTTAPYLSTRALYRAGVLTDIGIVDPGLSILRPNTNSVGQFVGNAVAPTIGRVLWDPRTGLHQLDTLLPAGWTTSDVQARYEAIFVNDLGHILTTVFDPGGVKHLVILTPVTTLPTGSDVVAQAGSTTLTFSTVTSPGDTTVSSIDPSAAGSVPGGFAISNTLAYEISTTAAFSGTVTVAFVIPGPMSAAEFNALRVLHNDHGTLVDVTSSADYSKMTIYATTASFSPFYIARRGQHIAALFDTSKAYKAGSTVPIKLQVVNTDGSNASASTLPVQARSVIRVQDSTAVTVADSGNANPDLDFRFDPTIGGTGGYIYNLSTKGLARGRYSLSLTVGGSAAFIYTVGLEVQ